MALPPKNRKRILATKDVERLNKEIKRRARMVSLFPYEESLLGLVSAISRRNSPQDGRPENPTLLWRASDRSAYFSERMLLDPFLDLVLNRVNTIVLPR
ncbi:MAG: transposase [Planctomycetes bacterium]|nr:transposase [Planctomycetota bacterium]